MGTVSSHAYLYNALSQRTKATVEDLSWWLYDYYNERGEVTEASKRWYGGAGLRHLGRTYRYGYDSIGNRTSAQSGGDSAGNGTLSFFYSANNLNQLTSITNPDSFDVAGMSIHPTVKVNTVNAARQDDYYHRELAHTGRPGFLGVTVQSYDAQGQPVGSPETGEVYVRASETLNYDADGNLLGDGRWIYGWHAEDRLISMETQPQAVSGIPAAQSVKLLFDYDWMGRRIRKRVYQPASAGTPVGTERYAWDGWLCAAKLDGAQTEAYVWGVDLAGSLSATGGVGGLAAILDLNGESVTISGVHFPAYDGNGNVMALVSDVSFGTFAYRPWKGWGYSPVTGLFEVQNGWRKYMKDAGAVRWVNLPIIDVLDLLPYDMARYFGKGGTDAAGTQFYTIKSAKAWREESVAYKCLCNGDRPKYPQLEYK